MQRPGDDSAGAGPLGGGRQNDAEPAASLILLCDRPAGPPLILMARRSAALAFAGGAYVFPGGRVEPEDVAAAAAFDLDDAAARIAAIRETREETGIAVATPIEALVPFARWCPRLERIVRRFDTRFYLARSDHPHEPTADGSESSHAFWASAAEVLARCARGDGRAIFPTRRMLERLACFGSYAEAVAQAERLPTRIISPWVETRADGERLCIPEDAGYPVTSEPLATALRY